MFEAITPSTLDMCSKKIGKYVSRYGSTCWMLIYQTDVRARLELTERIRREAMAAQSRAGKAGLAHDFDPAKPWEYVYLQLINGSDSWWKEELEDPCLLIGARIKQQNVFVDGDAEITGTGGGGNRGGGGGNLPQPKRPKVDPPPSQPDTTRQSEHSVVNGRYTTNRKGGKLCPDFQTGACVAVKGVCPKNNGAHQCDRCLSNAHPGYSCSLAPKQTARQAKAKTGKGKGGGKGQGKW
jgi:hypothetical protein